MAGHSRLSASSAPRWVACPGSVRLVESLPEAQRDTESEYAREGTAAHKLLETCLLLGIDASDYLGTLLDGFEVTEEMVEAVQAVLNTVQRIRDAYSDAVIFTERWVSLRRLGRPDAAGTADVILWSPRARVLSVVDLKYGQGVVVEAENNLQLGTYVIGAICELEVTPKRADGWIVQPRAHHADGPVRSMTWGGKALVSLKHRLLTAAGRTDELNAALVTGPHCRFCPAAAVCPAKLAHAEAMAMTAFRDEPVRIPAPETLDAETFVRALNATDALEDWCRAVRGHAQRLLEAGETVPGWKLVPKRAVRKWKDEQALLLWAEEEGIGEDVTEIKVRSVAQVEKVASRASILFPVSLYSKESAGVTLAPDTDARPAVAANLPFTALPSDGSIDSGSDGE